MKRNDILRRAVLLLAPVHFVLLSDAADLTALKASLLGSIKRAPDDKGRQNTWVLDEAGNPVREQNGELHKHASLITADAVYLRGAVMTASGVQLSNPTRAVVYEYSASRATHSKRK